jgi:hypothetical protein
MERFRLRVRHEAKRGQIWELHMFPAMPNRQPREVDAKIMGSSSSPVTIQWLRQVSEPYLAAAEEPGPIAAADFRPGVPARWLRHADGLRLALAFASARYLTKPALRDVFRSGLLELPAEVVLYWFTLCFYGYRQSAGRAALRTLLTYEEPAERAETTAAKGRRSRKSDSRQGTLFGEMAATGSTNGAADNGTAKKPKARSRKKG